MFFICIVEGKKNNKNIEFEIIHFALIGIFL